MPLDRLHLRKKNKVKEGSTNLAKEHFAKEKSYYIAVNFEARQKKKGRNLKDACVCVKHTFSMKITSGQ